MSTKIARIRIDGGTQTRAAIRRDVVEEYAAVIEAGGDLPPVVVFDDGTHLWLADGFHRLDAYLLAGKPEMPAEIKRGTKRDALLYAAGANHDHGLRRSNEDKRRAIRMLLEDEEWAGRSNAWISQICKVSDHTVASVREESTSQTRGCHQKTEENGPKSYFDHVNRLGKDGREHPAHSRFDEIDFQPDEVVDDDDVVVPGRLRPIFQQARLFESAELSCARAVGPTQAYEATEAYRILAKEGKLTDLSSTMQTGATRAKDLRPSVVCPKCVGDGCEECHRRGWLTAGERNVLRKQ